MIIPLDSLQEETLNNIITEFVLTEGTEYGEQDIPLTEKIAQVKNQLAKGSALIVYSELHETVNIVPADKFNTASEYQ